MSADRPFTESEVRFLKYVRRWGKKVVFVVNKVLLLNFFGVFQFKGIVIIFARIFGVFWCDT